ncbi:MAG: DNA-formamidopyrimidine glycosylase family protein [Thermoanaerobaculia bacterium]
MPEIPDLTIYLEALRERLGERRLIEIRFLSPFVLRSVTPAASDLVGRKVIGFRRLGKRIVLVLEGESFIVIHLMIAGRLVFHATAPGARRKAPGRITLAAFEFDCGTLYLTEAGKKRRASIHLVAGEAALALHDPGGIEPLTADLASFRTALTAENRTLKRALTDPRVVAGVGNAYSDEILHAARLSPFLRTAELTDEGFARLFRATQEKLAEWTDRLRQEAGGEFPGKVTAFHDEMAVHGRYGKACPVCATPVQRIVYAENEANYCPGCQTAGKLLADRLLSRLLHDDWPKSVAEMEEMKEKRSAGKNALALVVGGICGLCGLAAGAPASPVLPAIPAIPAMAGVSHFAAAELPGAPSLKLAGEPDPPLGRDVQLTLPLPALQPDPDRLARARALLGERLRESRLGGYLFLTDIEDPVLLRRAARLVESLESTYAARYGRIPLGLPREAIVLFAREGEYRVFLAIDPRLVGIASSTGLAGRGVIATYRGERSDNELLGTLVHEITHLLNRRAIGPLLPPWLDEGMADDLGAAAIDVDGRLTPGTWSRAVSLSAHQIHVAGGEAAIRELARRLAAKPGEPSPIDLGSILDLEWEAFVSPASAEENYAVASGFLRMLLSDPAQSAIFRNWLAEVSFGASPRVEELRELLGPQWSELEAELGTWVRAEVDRLPPLVPKAVPPVAGRVAPRK